MYTSLSSSHSHFLQKSAGASVFVDTLQPGWPDHGVPFCSVFVVILQSGWPDHGVPFSSVFVVILQSGWSDHGVPFSSVFVVILQSGWPDHGVPFSSVFVVILQSGWPDHGVPFSSVFVVILQSGWPDHGVPFCGVLFPVVRPPPGSVRHACLSSPVTSDVVTVASADVTSSFADATGVLMHVPTVDVMAGVESAQERHEPQEARSAGARVCPVTGLAEVVAVTSASSCVPPVTEAVRGVSAVRSAVRAVSVSAVLSAVRAVSGRGVTSDQRRQIPGRTRGQRVTESCWQGMATAKYYEK